MPADRVTRARSGPQAPDTLIGRDRELALIRESLDGSTAGRGAILLLVGEPGMGKTALLGAAMAYARANGILVLHGAGTEVEGPGFSGLTQAVVPLMAYADRLNPARHKALSVALGLAEGRLPQLTKVSQAVLALLKAVSAEQPIVLIADDIQWLDTYSAEVLSFVADRVAGSRVAVLAASRSSPLCPLGRAGFARHDLAPLDAPSSDALLRARFPMLTPGVRRRLLDDAAGNPLALLELPPALSGRQRAALQDLPTVLPLSERLQAAFASRIARLPSATRDLLLLAALDTTADLHVLRAAAGVPVLDDLAHAERERLVDIDDEQHRMMFRHPLTRSANSIG
jgi:predicted ATPase